LRQLGYNTIAQFQPGTENIVSGRLFEVSNLNEHALDYAARDEAGKIASFYKELSTPVSESSKSECYDTLHSIIGN
jgi:hypothetical protein